MANSNKKSKYSERYLIYTRKSTDDSENQKNSIDYQKNQCLKFAVDYKFDIADYSLDGFCKNGIIEEKHSAFKQKEDMAIDKNGIIQYRIERPKFQILIQKLMGSEFKGVICLCWDRISRNNRDGMVVKNLIEMGIDIKFVQANYEKTSSGALHMDIDDMFSAHYSRVIREKVKLAHDKLRSEGKCTYFAPIGYLDKGSGNKPIDPERAPIVRRIFEMYATGEWGLRQLANWANKQGLTTKPMRRNRTREEILSGVKPEDIPQTLHPINDKTIEHILLNPFYIGKLKIDKKDNTKYITGNHQPLIDVALYNKVQEALKKRNKCIHYMDKDFYIYRGLIACPCGRSYSPYTKKGINYYRSRCKDGCANPEKNLREDKIDEEVAKVLGQIHFTDEELMEIEERAKGSLDNINQERNSELDDLNNERKRIYADLNYLTKNKITLLRNNVMSIEDIGEQESKLKQELEMVEQKTAAHKEAAGEMLNYIVTFSELVKNASLYYKHALDSEKREIATQVFSELVFNNKILANYNAKEGFEALIKTRDAKLGCGGRI
ncbi:recombinase family protein [Candidatus Kuenenbacteria bacterium]|nr:recombinase family protein [Candidatus Kuenenbacteria bacterium]